MTNSSRVIFARASGGTISVYSSRYAKRDSTSAGAMSFSGSSGSAPFVSRFFSPVFAPLPVGAGIGGGDAADTLSERENEERLPTRGSSGVLAPRSDSFFFRIWTGEPDVDVLRPLIAR
jgi:hypothetical protein